MASLKQKIESLLFVAGRSVTFRDMARVTKVMVSQVQEIVAELSREYEEKERGMQVLVKGPEAQMVSHGETREATESFLKEDIEGNLSRSALETLAIVAYRQPITRPEIDFIRGVNSSIMLRNLLIRGLVDRCRSRRDARVYEYSLSFDFLKLLGISRAEELPDFTELNQSEAVRMLEKATAKSSISGENEKKKLGKEDIRKVPVHVVNKNSSK